MPTGLTWNVGNSVVPTAPEVICEGDTWCLGLLKPYSVLFSFAQVDFNDFGETRLQLIVLLNDFGLRVRRTNAST